MKKSVKSLLAGLAACAVLSFGASAEASFNEIEDLSRAGTLGNKEVFTAPEESYEQELILGQAQATQAQMIAYILSRNPSPKLSCTLEELVGYYYEECAIEGVRADIALCQALKETGFFNYGGDVHPRQNNYCGLGATGNKAPGYSFFTAQRGVRAHIQHLVAYASKERPKTELVDPRFDILVTRYPQYHGAISYWVGLNGRWAVPGDNYGQDILHLWHEALNF